MTSTDLAAGSRRGRRLPPDERRDQLVACAARLFAERPYAEVSTTDIAREAGTARGLLNHYFGDKRGLYLEVVRRSVLLPLLEEQFAPGRGPLEQRVEVAVAWFLDSVEPRAASYATVVGAGAVAEDAEVAAIIDEADDLAARRLLEMMDLDADDEASRAVVRAYGGLAKAAVREWVRGDTLDRRATHRLLAGVLLHVLRDALPGTGGSGGTGGTAHAGSPGR